LEAKGESNTHSHSTSGITDFVNVRKQQKGKREKEGDGGKQRAKHDYVTQ
jgi:hypothetical protein